MLTHGGSVSIRSRDRQGAGCSGGSSHRRHRLRSVNLKDVNAVNLDGVIIVDKPHGWTSHDVVNKMRRFAGTRKVGHLGTLDPSATGVLPLVIGRATRLAQFYNRNDKIYEGVIHFGNSTDSYDADGVATSPVVEVSFDRATIDAALEHSR